MDKFYLTDEQLDILEKDSDYCMICSKIILLIKKEDDIYYVDRDNFEDYEITHLLKKML